ncbi:MAG: hypothetical protein JKX70_02970 [Phycisphaerales bacterium]|nr:hypothetical protein [Phycisphaerales bacterium]
MMMRRLMILMVAVIGMLGSDAFATYDMGLGRWLQKDPAGYVDGMNSYEVVGSSPTSYSDSFGLARHVIALEGWGAQSGVSDRFVGPGTDIFREAVNGYNEEIDDYDQGADGYLVKKENYHTYFYTGSQQAIAKARDVYNTENTDCTTNTITLIGFSNGADRAHDVAKALRRENIPVELLFMIDPVPAGVFEGFGSLVLGRTYSRPSNVVRAVNVYQRSGNPKGWPMPNANMNMKLTQSEMNPWLDPYIPFFRYHASMPRQPMVLWSWPEWLKKVPSEQDR